MGRSFPRDLAILAAGTAAAAIGAMLTQDDAWLSGEDGVLETLSALLYAGAALVVLVQVWRRGRATRPALLLLGPFALLCALDEISFGARLFDWRMPEMQGGGEFDGAHDSLMLLLRAWQGWFAQAPSLAIAAIVVPLALLLAGGIVLRRAIGRAAALVLNDPVLLRMAGAASLLALATLVDLGLVAHRLADHVEEWAETAAGFMMLAAALAGAAEPLSVSRTASFRTSLRAPHP
jgi:hypothetical protein